MPALKIELDLDDNDLSAKMDRNISAVQKFTGSTTNAARGLKDMESASKGLLATMRDVTIAVSQGERALGLIEQVSTSWVRKIVDVNAEFERMVTVMRSLSTAADPLADATKKVEELRNMARDAPFSLDAIHASMTRMSAAGLGTTQNMKALMDAVSAFGGGDNELNRAALAFQEMAGKGVVQMKELRNQLMLAVPSAGSLIARAFGESYAQVMSDIHTGTVDARTTVQGLMLEFERAFGGDAQRQQRTFNGLLNQTRALLTAIAINDTGKPLAANGMENEGGFFGQVKKQVQDFNAFLDSAPAHVIGQDIGNGLKSAVQDLRAMFDIAVSFHTEIAAAVEALAFGFAFKAGIAAFSSVAGIAGSIKASIVGIGEAWQTAMGNIAEGGLTTAANKLQSLRSQAVDAAKELTVAEQRQRASAQLAAEARRVASAPATTAARTVEEQAKLDMDALRARAALNREIIAQEQAEAQSLADAEERISAQRVLALHAEEQARTYGSTGGWTAEGQARRDLAASNANAAFETERLNARKIQLNEIADAEARVALAREASARAEAARAAAPAAANYTAAEQAALDMTAINAETRARKDAGDAEQALAHSNGASRAAALAEQEGAGSRLSRAWGAASAFLPVLASGFGAVAVAAPIAALAIGALSDYFDIFNLHAKEAWQNLEHYGASSLEAAQAGQAYLDQLKQEIEMLKQKEALAKKRELAGASSMPFDEENMGRRDSTDLAAERLADIKKVADNEREMERFKQQGMTEDARRYSRQRADELERGNMAAQLKYNTESNNAAKEFTRITNEMNKQHRSIVGETATYQESQKKRALAYYDQEIDAIQRLIDAQQKLLDSSTNAASKVNAAQTINDAFSHLNDVQAQRKAEADQQMGLFKNTKPIDDKKLIQNAEAEVEKLEASIDGFKAGIEGSDEAAEKLYQTWLRMGKAGDTNVAGVRELLDHMKALKQEADDYNKIMEGGHKLNKDINDAVDKDNDEIFKNQYGKASNYQQLQAKMSAGRYPGFGGDDAESKRLTELRQEADRYHASLINIGMANEGAFGSKVVSYIDLLTGALRGNSNALTNLAGGLQGIGSAPASLNGSVMAGNNPGNIENSDIARRYGGTDGKRFSEFPTAADGYRAANANLDSYAGEGRVSPHDIIMKWAPPKDHNNTDQYIADISKASGVDPNSPLPTDKRADFLHSMTQIEKGSSPYSSDQIRGFIGAPNDYEKAQTGLQTVAERDAALRQSDLTKALTEFSTKLQVKDYAEGLEAKGVGKNRAAYTAYLHENAFDLGVGDEAKAEKDPRFQRTFALADQRDRDDATLKKTREDTTAAQSAQKVNQEKLASSAADLANVFARVTHAAGAVSEATQREIDSAANRRDTLIKRYGAGSAEGQKATSDYQGQVDNFKSLGAADDILQSQKKVAALKESTMTQIDADNDRVAKLREHYNNDLANFKGTEAQKEQLAKLANDHIAAEQAALAAKTPLGKEMKDWADMTHNMQQNMATFANSGVDSLTTYIMTGKNQWRSFADTILKDLTSTALKGGISALMGGTGLTGMLGGAGGGGKINAGGAAAAAGGGGKGGAAGAPMQLAGAAATGGASKGFGVHHTGGLVGAGEGPLRLLNIASAMHHFGGAPRFHSGGITGDEVPIIAQRGEGVFTKGQMAAIGAGVSKNNVPGEFHLHNNVVVNAQGGDSSQNADLAKQIGEHMNATMRGAVIDEIRNQMRPGNFLATDPMNTFSRGN